MDLWGGGGQGGRSGMLVVSCTGVDQGVQDEMPLVLSSRVHSKKQ